MILRPLQGQRIVVKGYISQALGVRTGVLGEYHTEVMRVKFFRA
jgi:hypothetical protein